MADQYYNFVSLLLHCDGVNGSTTFTDNSSSPKTITPTGNAQISTAQGMFGGASALFDGNGDYLTVPTGLILGTNDFTFEGWVWISSNPVTNVYNIATYSAATTGFNLEIDLNGKLGFYTYAATSTYNISSTSVSLNAWNHFAVVRNSNTFYIFLNGVLEITVIKTESYITSVLTIGRSPAVIARDFLGYIDEIRLTNLVRYTANFTPPTVAFDTTIEPPTYSRTLNTALSKSAFQWVTLPNYYRYVPAALGKTLVNYSSSPKRYTNIYTYKARHDFNNAYFGGTGVIAGTIKIGVDAVKRRVRLYENSTGILVREMWTNTDGTYSFTGLKKDYTYTVTTTDIDNVYNDIIYSNITAV